MSAFNGKLAICRKQGEIRLKLLLVTDKKWDTLFQIKWKSWTLDNLEGHWQRVQSAILATVGLFSGYWCLSWPVVLSDIGLGRGVTLICVICIRNGLCYIHILVPVDCGGWG